MHDRSKKEILVYQVMDQSQQREQQPIAQISNLTPALSASSAVPTSNLSAPVSSPTLPPRVPNSQNQLARRQFQRFRRQQQQLKLFWENQKQEAKQTTNFNIPGFPLSRVKKLMKADKDVKSIASETPVIMSKACEMFIQDLTLSSWPHTEDNKRSILIKDDVAAAISENDTFEFLDDTVPTDPTIPHVGSSAHPTQNHPIPVSPTGITLCAACQRPKHVPCMASTSATVQHQQQNDN